MNQPQSTSTALRHSSVRNLVLTAMLGAISAVLMSIQFPVPFAPPFYQLDFAEVPVLIGGFVLGPTSAVGIALIKVLVKLVLRGTETAFLGEAINFVGSIIFVLPAALFYKKMRTTKGATIGVALSVVFGIAWSCWCNAYVSLPMYARLYGWPIERLIAMGSAVNGNITDMRTFVLFAVMPFNLLKNTLVGLITVLLIRRDSLFRRFQ